MPPPSSWNARRVALAVGAAALLIFAVLSARPLPAPLAPARHHYYYIQGLSGLYTVDPSEGLAASLKLWALQLLPYLPSLLLGLAGLIGLALGFRGTRPRRR